MTFEARLIFILFFFAVWGILGFLPWSFAAAVRRGRHVLPALPLAIAAASLAGVLVPLLGARDVTGFFVSIAAAFAAGAFATVAGIAITVRLTSAPTSASTDEKTE